MPKPLEGIRILDFTWLNAGAKGTRHLANFGAEVIRIEWKGKMDFTRFGYPFHQRPGEPPPPTGHGHDPSRLTSFNRAAGFNDVNTGKRGISLNMQHPKGKELFRRLLTLADVVTDNFTPLTLDRWGFSHREMQRYRPDIIYVQASGFGRIGPYRDFRSYGPIANAVSGLQYMAGLPDRYTCGYQFSYLDVAAPWFLCMALIAALHSRAKTGKGPHIDLSQVGPGFLLTSTAVLDYTVNGRPYQRTGDRAPFTTAAPHGAYRCQGEDRWVAIAVSNQEEWKGFCNVLGNPAWTQDPKFATRLARSQNQDELDKYVGAWTIERDRYAVMHALQQAGVPAGVCQDTSDRIERDEQFKSRGYLEEVNHSEVPPYRVEGVVGKWSETQPAAGGPHGWGAPCYGEHNRHIYGDILGLSDKEIEALAEEDVI